MNSTTIGRGKERANMWEAMFEDNKVEREGKGV